LGGYQLTHRFTGVQRGNLQEGEKRGSESLTSLRGVIKKPIREEGRPEGFGKKRVGKSESASGKNIVDQRGSGKGGNEYGCRQGGKGERGKGV